MDFFRFLIYFIGGPESELRIFKEFPSNNCGFLGRISKPDLESRIIKEYA